MTRSGWFTIIVTRSGWFKIIVTRSGWFKIIVTRSGWFTIIVTRSGLSTVMVMRSSWFRVGVTNPLYVINVSAGPTTYPLTMVTFHGVCRTAINVRMDASPVLGGTIRRKTICPICEVNGD